MWFGMDFEIHWGKSIQADLVQGVKPHTDISEITVLLQDREVEGLQVLIDDKWIKRNENTNL